MKKSILLLFLALATFSLIVFVYHNASDQVSLNGKNIELQIHLPEKNEIYIEDPETSSKWIQIVAKKANESFTHLLYNLIYK